MDLIFTIGRQCYPHDPERLFAHHMGDAFYIASSLHEERLDRCASIVIALMRGMTEIGCVARASIAEGSIADYSGTRPRKIQEASLKDGDQHVISLGEGIMTLQSVMGQGLINAVTIDKLASNALCKGSLLLIPTEMASRLSKGFVLRQLPAAPDISAVDWIHSTSSILDAIENELGVARAAPSDFEARLKTYVAHHGMKSTWSGPTFEFAGVAP